VGCCWDLFITLFWNVVVHAASASLGGAIQGRDTGEQVSAAMHVLDSLNSATLLLLLLVEDACTTLW
jgi:hypothetical protein